MSNNDRPAMADFSFPSEVVVSLSPVEEFDDELASAGLYSSRPNNSNGTDYAINWLDRLLFAPWPFRPEVDIINSERGDDLLILVKGTIQVLPIGDEMMRCLTVIIHVKHELVPYGLPAISRATLPFQLLRCTAVRHWNRRVQYYSVNLLIRVAAMLHGQRVDVMVQRRCELLVKLVQGDITYTKKEILEMELVNDVRVVE